MWLLAEFSSSRAVGRRATVLYWLSARGCPQYLATGPHQHQRLLAPSEPAKERAATKLEAFIFGNLSTRVTAHHLCHVLLMRSKSRSPGHSQGEEITRSEYQEVRLLGTILEEWLRLHNPNAGAPGSIPGQGIRSHVPQLKDPACCN